MPQDPTIPRAHDADEPAEKAFDRIVPVLRPQLHRYCARMTGSAIDGEDVVQEALLKAVEALPDTGQLTHPEGWLFRIAHNAALDFLRRRARYDAAHSDEDIAMIAAPEIPPPQAAAASLRTFMRLAVLQRSAVILRDVFGYSVREVSDIIGSTVPATKAALQRGRQRLGELAKEPDEISPPALAEAESARLKTYVDRFNARDFDAIRDMLADDVKLELVNRVRATSRGRVGEYFHRYSLLHDWQSAPGFVDGRPAVLMFDPNDPGGRPANFILLDWTGNKVASIRDFHFARYALETAEIREML